MGLLHSAMDAALELRSKVELSQIQRIDIDMPDAAYGHGEWKAERPLQPIGAQMNVAYVVAVAFLDGDVLIGQFSQDRIDRDDVWALIGRTLTHHERAYDHLPADERLTTQLRLTFKDGSTRAAKVAHPRGTGDRKPTNAEIRDKYAELTHQYRLCRAPSRDRKYRPRPRHSRRCRSADCPAHTRRALAARLRPSDPVRTGAVALALIATWASRSPVTVLAFAARLSACASA
jgi:hypothetical protein